MGEELAEAAGSDDSDAPGGDIQTAFDALSFFDGLPRWVVDRLRPAARIREMRPGDEIIRQNDEARHLFFVLEGETTSLLRLEGFDDLVVGPARRPSGLLGWSMFRPPHRHTASVRCDTACRVLVLPREAIESVSTEDSAVEYELLRRLTRVVADCVSNLQSGTATPEESSGP